MMTLRFDSDINAHQSTVNTRLNVGIFRMHCTDDLWNKRVRTCVLGTRDFIIQILVGFCVRKHAARVDGTNLKVCRRKWSS